MCTVAVTLNTLYFPYQSARILQVNARSGKIWSMLHVMTNNDPRVYSVALFAFVIMFTDSQGSDPSISYIQVKWVSRSLAYREAIKAITWTRNVYLLAKIDTKILNAMCKTRYMYQLILRNRHHDQVYSYGFDDYSHLPNRELCNNIDMVKGLNFEHKYFWLLKLTHGMLTILGNSIYFWVLKKSYKNRFLCCRKELVSVGLEHSIYFLILSMWIFCFVKFWNMKRQPRTGKNTNFRV